MPVKFFDKQVNLTKVELEKLYYMMSDITKIDTWHKYMSNPVPICDFECVYDWTDDVRNKIVRANSKFTMIHNSEMQFIHYTITPLKYNPYYNHFDVIFPVPYLRLFDRGHISLHSYIFLLFHLKWLSF